MATSGIEMMMMMRRMIYRCASCIFNKSMRGLKAVKELNQFTRFSPSFLVQSDALINKIYCLDTKTRYFVNKDESWIEIEINHYFKYSAKHIALKKCPR